MKVNWVSESEIQCSICTQVKPKEEYPWSTSNSRSGYYFSYCKMCRKTKQREGRLRRSPWPERTNKIKLRASTAGIPYDLDAGFLSHLWDEQKGLCFYTDYDMVGAWGSGLSINSLSVDKIIPELGYVKTNVVLCTQRANTIKNNMTLDEMKLWMPTWHARIQSRLEF